MSKANNDYTLPERFSANQKELLQVFHDKEAVSLFGNGEPMSANESVMLNRTVKEKLRAGASERDQDRIHRMPTFATNYNETLRWIEAVTATPTTFNAAMANNGVIPSTQAADTDEQADPMASDAATKSKRDADLPSL